MPQRQHQARGADGQVDEEHPPPAHRRDQQPAQEWSGRGGDARHRTPQPEGPRPCCGRRVGLLEQGQRTRDDQRRAESLHQPGRHQEEGGRRERARGRGDREHRHARAEDPPVPQPVAQCAGGQQEPGEDQGVAVGDPLDAGERGPELSADDRHGDIDDGHIEDHHEIPGAHRQQRCEARLIGPRARDGRGRGLAGTARLCERHVPHSVPSAGFLYKTPQ